VQTTLRTIEDQLPPLVVVEFTSSIANEQVMKIVKMVVPEESLTVVLDKSRAMYDLAAVIYHVSGLHFVCQFNYMGRAFFHDGMENQGRAVVVGSAIDVGYAFRLYRNCSYAKAVYARRHSASDSDMDLISASSVMS
jgi:hypothetical protein